MRAPTWLAIAKAQARPAPGSRPAMQLLAAQAHKMGPCRGALEEGGAWEHSHIKARGKQQALCHQEHHTPLPCVGISPRRLPQGLS
jgi:hypothetical protein